MKYHIGQQVKVIKYRKPIDQYATIVEIENDTYARVTLEADSWTIRVKIKNIAPIRKDKLNLL